MGGYHRAVYDNYDILRDFPLSTQFLFTVNRGSSHTQFSSQDPHAFPNPPTLGTWQPPSAAYPTAQVRGSPSALYLRPPHTPRAIPKPGPADPTGHRSPRFPHRWLRVASSGKGGRGTVPVRGRGEGRLVNYVDGVNAVRV